MASHAALSPAYFSKHESYAGSWAAGSLPIGTRYLRLKSAAGMESFHQPSTAPAVSAVPQSMPARKARQVPVSVARNIAPTANEPRTRRAGERKRPSSSMTANARNTRDQENVSRQGQDGKHGNTNSVTMFRRPDLAEAVRSGTMRLSARFGYACRGLLGRPAQGPVAPRKPFSGLG
jgi:hypothetical protein